LRPYEVMVIFDAGLEEDAIRDSVDRAVELIRSRGGTPGRVDRWGRRRFAYELRHRWEGYYVLIDATAEPQVMADLDRMLFLADEVLRHKVIRLPDAVAGRQRGSTPPPPADAPAPVEEPAAVAAGQDNEASEQ
jgi:small subunit ribosomal protein S6